MWDGADISFGCKKYIKFVETILCCNSKDKRYCVGNESNQSLACNLSRHQWNILDCSESHTEIHRLFRSVCSIEKHSRFLKMSLHAYFYCTLVFFFIY